MLAGRGKSNDTDRVTRELEMRAPVVSPSISRKLTIEDGICASIRRKLFRTKVRADMATDQSAAQVDPLLTHRFRTVRGRYIILARTELNAFHFFSILEEEEEKKRV